MKVLLRISLFVCLLVTAVSAAAQSDDYLLQSLIEEWAEQNDSESIPDELMEQLQDFRENPINLNDTSSRALYFLPFLSDYHRDAISAYIAVNGYMVSPAELFLLNGFDSLTLQILSLFTTVAPVDDNCSISFKKMMTQGVSNLRTGFKTVMPRSRGYLEDKYEGDPFRVYFRYNYRYRDKIAFQLSGDKDPGESFRGQQPIPGFDNYGYYLMLNDFGILKRAIVGKYYLQFGQGATLWSGFAPWITDGISLWRYGQGIKPAGPFAEYGYFNGLAATVGITKHLELTAFYSTTMRDATFADTASDGSLIFQSIYNSGYHRTVNEMDKENRLHEQLYGCHLQYLSGGFTLGATAFATRFDDMIIPANYKYNGFYFRGKDNFNAGLDFTWRHRKLTIFGEAAVAANDSIMIMRQQSDFMSVAAVAGFNYHFTADNVFSLAARYGSPIYHNLYCNTIGQTSDVQNDMGVILAYRMRLPFYIYLNGSADFFRRPWMRYRIYSPSHGADVRIHAYKQLSKHFNMDMRYRYRSDMRNVTGQPDVVEHTYRQQFTVALLYSPSAHWKLHSRAAYSHFACEMHESQHGVVLLQDVEWNSLGKRPLSLAARVALFNITDYDARFYFYESDLMYEYGVPMLNGRGIRTGLLMRYELSYNLSFAFKYALNYYPDNETIGSSYEKIEGNKKHEVKFQLRWRF